VNKINRELSSLAQKLPSLWPWEPVYLCSFLTHFKVFWEVLVECVDSSCQGTARTHVHVVSWRTKAYGVYHATRKEGKSCKTDQPLVPPIQAIFYIFPIVAKHRFSSDHTRPEWFSAPSIHWMPELVVDEPEPPPCPACTCWPIVTDQVK